LPMAVGFCGLLVRCRAMNAEGKFRFNRCLKELFSRDENLVLSCYPVWLWVERLWQWMFGPKKAFTCGGGLR
jgi:hypothetical protein